MVSQHFSNLVPGSKIMKSYITESFIILLRKKKLQIKLWGHFFMVAAHKFLPECRVPHSKGFITVVVVSLCDIPSGSQSFKAQ
jgi:hypothetical protein